MKILIILLLFLIISYSSFCQSKDSTQIQIFSGYGAHNGLCCMNWADTIIMHWSWERKEWCLLTDSVYNVYYKKSNYLNKQLKHL